MKAADGLQDFMDVRGDVAQAVDAGEPVLALESTIIAHGMPYPRNVETAMQALKDTEARGVRPAVVAILDGRIKIGLTDDQIERLGKSDNVGKVSRRDVARTVSARLSGATTVSGTMLLSHAAGIMVFATGGIGGVHRGAGTQFDVSADMTELARTPQLVISAGAKAILDLPATVEYLETLGVPVVGYRTDQFPAFYSRDSGSEVPIRVESEKEAAELFVTHSELGLEQAVLVVNPVPPESEIERSVMEGYIGQALRDLEASGRRGREVTPYLLSRVVELSDGRALETNIALFHSNVELGCGIAIEVSNLFRIREQQKKLFGPGSTTTV